MEGVVQYRIFAIFLLLTSSALYGDIEDLDSMQFNEMNAEPLFVSLGSHCGPAHMLRFCEKRQAAFPFDWIISFDGEALIKILEDDFWEFTNDAYFTPFGPAGHLLHTYYHLEFLHDGNFNDTQFLASIELMKSKYQRRIRRFRQIEAYPGKVFFIRQAFEYSNNDPHRYYKFKENIEISDEYSFRLYEALKRYFPQLNFCLIIINHHFDRDTFEIERRLSDHLFVVRENPIKLCEQADCNKFFLELLHSQDSSHIEER